MIVTTVCSALLCQRDLLVTEVEDSGGVDSCLQFLDETAGCWPTAVALDLLRLALDCTASRHRSRPSMQKVSNTISILTLMPIVVYFYIHVEYNGDSFSSYYIQYV